LIEFYRFEKDLFFELMASSMAKIFNTMDIKKVIENDI